jgi:hypothetical protein
MQMDDEQLMEHILDILHEFYQQNSAQMRQIGKIRDVLERRANEHIRLDQIIKCGIELATRGFIRIEEQPGKHPLSGWVDAIILQNGINHIESRNRAKVS